MAKLTIKFEVNQFPMILELGNDTAKTADVLKQVNNAITGIKRIGGKAPGVPDETHRCKADYIIAEKGTTPDTRKNTYYKVYGKLGTWIHSFGVTIWQEVHDPLAEQSILPVRESMEIGKEYDLTGYDVVFGIEESSTTPGKMNPKRVLELIKT